MCRLRVRITIVSFDLSYPIVTYAVDYTCSGANVGRHVLTSTAELSVTGIQQPAGAQLRQHDISV
ncbi:hypothetical protein J6590_035655 [Homalodisca vitripennis]|nr:hypothetical protein J6590_035655 [Homalodisca vitripennis]